LFLLFFLTLIFASALVTHPASPKSGELKSERIAPASLRHLNVLGTWPFLSARFVECDALSFAEVVEAYAFKAGRMKEQVFIAANVNESKTFVSKSFNRAFSHSQILKGLGSIRLNRIIQPESLRDHHSRKFKGWGYNSDLQRILAT
jgi:hypothetical protein